MTEVATIRAVKVGPETDMLPHSIEAEQQLLGAILTNNDIYDRIASIVRAEHFFDPVHRRIYEIAIARIQKNALASPVTLKGYLEEDEGLKQLGGPAYLARIAGAAISAFAARDYAQMIHDLAVRRELIGLGRDITARAQVMEAVRRHFRPEFLNRLDDMIIFDRLSRDDMDGIVAIQLGLLDARLASRKITLDLDRAARTWLADEGYDPVYGARPLKRVLQRSLQDRLAEMILAGEVTDESTVPVTVGPDGLIVGSLVSGSNRPRPEDAVVH